MYFLKLLGIELYEELGEELDEELFLLFLRVLARGDDIYDIYLFSKWNLIQGRK